VKIKFKILSILIMVTLVISAFTIGQMFYIGNIFAATYGTQLGQLTELGQKIESTTADNCTFTATLPDAEYQLTVIGGSSSTSNGGQVKAKINLKAGDELLIEFSPGGAAGAGNGYSDGTGKTAGGNSVQMYLKNLSTMIVGAGGAGGRGDDQNLWSPSLSGIDTAFGEASKPGGISTVYIENGVTTGSGIFGSGGGGGAGGFRTKTGAIKPGGNGSAGSNGVAGGAGGAPGAGKAGQGGANFINKDKVYDATSECSGSASLTGKFIIECLGKKTEPVDLTTVVQKIEGVDSKVSSLQDRNYITAIKSKAFDETLFCDDKVASTEISSANYQCSIENSDTTDGIVRITGRFDDVGTSVLSVPALQVIIKVVEEPDSSNVNVVFN
jgi:hypothetical protein